MGRAVQSFNDPKPLPASGIPAQTQFQANETIVRIFEVNSAFVQGKVFCEEKEGRLKPLANALVKIEFVDSNGMVKKGPYFAITDDQGDYIVCIDPVPPEEANSLQLKVFAFCNCNVVRKPCPERCTIDP